MSLRSVFTITYSICAAVMPVLTTSCSAPPPQRVAAFAGVQMGESRFPRHGEGELITVESPLPEGFDRCRVEVTPFEHKVFRIRLEAAEIPGNDDAIRSVKLIAQVIANAVIEAKQGEAIDLTVDTARPESLATYIATFKSAADAGFRGRAAGGCPGGD